MKVKLKPLRYVFFTEKIEEFMGETIAIYPFVFYFVCVFILLDLTKNTKDEIPLFTCVLIDVNFLCHRT